MSKVRSQEGFQNRCGSKFVSAGRTISLEKIQLLNVSFSTLRYKYRFPDHVVVYQLLPCGLYQHNASSLKSSIQGREVAGLQSLTLTVLVTVSAP